MRKLSEGRRYDAVVVGAGHAGAEASYILSKLGFETALVTQKKDAVARMSCNPSVGGVGKGHLVREIDALGGLMAKAADRTGIQFRVLNQSKGPAAQGLRCQSDRKAYSLEVQDILGKMKSLEIIEGEAVGIEIGAGKVKGLFLEDGRILKTCYVVISSGTFLRGKIFTGLEATRGGRVNEQPSDLLSLDLEKKGVEFKRLKTGTPARLDKDSINWTDIEKQEGDKVPEPFSLFSSPFPALPQVPCHITYTTKETAEIVRSYLNESPLFQGLIKGAGPRYCPSLEDKIVKFPHHERHQVFLEPDGIESNEIYPNGISTSLPREAQEKFIRSIPSLEKAEIITYGYAVEYDFVPPTGLDFGLCHKKIEGLYFAGQIIGTTGYEEAAGLGLYAGYNVAAKLLGKAPFRPERNESYLGVMVSDLVTTGVIEPYRLFTSRAEYRLLLDRHTAYRRLSGYAESMGLLPEEEIRFREEREDNFLGLIKCLRQTRFGGKGVDLYTLLKRSDADEQRIMEHIEAGGPFMRQYVASEVKNEGYRERQKEEATKLYDSMNVKIPPDLELKKIPGLSREILERLTSLAPETLLQASRIPGITPSALTILRVEIERRRKQ
jgi:tRNA uridine 5-carboxymethylaminomethyl modification enzyme